MAKKKINGGKGKPKKAKKPAVVVALPKKLKKALRDHEPEPDVERPAKTKRPVDKPKEAEAEISPTSQRTGKSSSRGYVSKANYVIGKETSRAGRSAKKFHHIKREYLGYLLMRLFLRTKKMQRLLLRKTVEE